MLQLRNLDKSYGTHRVLNDVSFDVLPGRLTGFVGGNGAGKTTTMRIVLGVLAAAGTGLSGLGVAETSAFIAVGALLLYAGFRASAVSAPRLTKTVPDT